MAVVNHHGMVTTPIKESLHLEEVLEILDLVLVPDQRRDLERYPEQDRHCRLLLVLHRLH